MTQADSPLDFGQGHWFEHLDASRLFLWDPGDLARLGQILELRPGLQVADFGCGWGYLGHLLLPLISPGGRVDGFELQQALIKRGRERIAEAGYSGRIVLHEADITELSDIDDKRFDLAICQTVLMHLSQPQQALAEMKRVVKPGGLVVAIEPNLLGAHASSYDSCGGEDFEHLRRRLLLETYVIEGCQLCGAGDYRIASKLPQLMADQGLDKPRLWMNPKINQCTPPYEDDVQRYRDFLADADSPEAAAAEEGNWKMMFDAAGGPQELWDLYQQREQQLRSERRRQLRDGSYSMAASNMLGVCTARVPG